MMVEGIRTMALTQAGAIPARLFERLKGVVRRESSPRALTPKEAWALYDSEARKHLGIPAEEFESAWEQGAFRDRLEDPAVLRVAMLRSARP
jgi:hypothetical protein